MRFRLIEKLERWFGRLAIPRLTLVLIVAQAAVFLAAMDQPELLARLVLIPQAVMAGEYWRLATMLAIPPMLDLWALLAWYFFYLLGSSLEQYWGDFRYNLFLLVGYVATVAVAFVTPQLPVTNAFLFGSVFLAFAYLNPDFVIYVMFILPLKIKWLALFTWILYALTFALGGWHTKLAVLASVANFLLFFGPAIVVRARAGQRRMVEQVRETARQKQPFHRCRVCGITDKSHPDTEFRYCSQCAGTCGYCPEHLRDHEHVTVETASGVDNSGPASS